MAKRKGVPADLKEKMERGGCVRSIGLWGIMGHARQKEFKNVKRGLDVRDGRRRKGGQAAQCSIERRFHVNK